AELRDSGDSKTAEAFARKGVHLAQKREQNMQGEPAVKSTLADCHETLGTVLQKAKRWKEAAVEFRLAMEIFQTLAADFPKENYYEYRHASATNFLGIALRNQSTEIETALLLHRKAIEICTQLVADFNDRPAYRRQLVRSYYALGIAQQIVGRWTEAEKAY